MLSNCCWTFESFGPSSFCFVLISYHRQVFILAYSIWVRRVLDLHYDIRVNLHRPSLFLFHSFWCWSRILFLLCSLAWCHWVGPTIAVICVVFCHCRLPFAAALRRFPTASSVGFLLLFCRSTQVYLRLNDVLVFRVLRLFLLSIR